jgi:hypothetical protein
MFLYLRENRLGQVIAMRVYAHSCYVVDTTIYKYNVAATKLDWDQESNNAFVTKKFPGTSY